MKRENIINDALDGAATFLLTTNQDNCSVNVDDIYEQINREEAKENLNRTEALVEITFSCDRRLKIHFLSENANVSEKVKIAVSLVLDTCDVYLEDFSVLQKYGIIVAIFHDNDSVINLPSHLVQCPFAQHVRMVTARITCDSTLSKRFFWEACKNVFEKVTFLRLSACNEDHVHLMSDTLVHTFPKVQTIFLENIDLANQMTFPWTHSYFDLQYDDERQFFLTGSETTSPENATRRRIQISDTLTVIGCSLQVSGRIAEIVFNNVKFKDNQGQIFANVSGLYRVDLSQNNLTEINELLFENQSELMEIRLKQNNLTNLPVGLFKNQLYLVYLDLSENRLTTVDQSLLRNLRFLQELHLEHNQLKRLPRSFLIDQIKSLKYLYLHSNPIVILPEMPFYGTKIEFIDLHNCKITGDSIYNLTTRLDKFDFMHTVAVKDTSKRQRETFGLSPRQRSKLDLSSNEIRHIRVNLTNNTQQENFKRLIESFDIKTDGNPIACQCELYATVTMMQLKIKSGIKFDWKCMNPEELRGRLIANITEHDMKCPVNLLDCPSMCSCYERLDLSSFIVDCRHTNISVLPKKMPKKYPLELWLQNASLLALDTRVYFENISVLDISNNTLTNISSAVANQLKSLNTLRLDTNKLASLPVQIKFMNISKISLDGNAFLCDCHTRWMLDWLLHDELCPVINKNILKCTDNNKHVKDMIQVPDSMFVCNEINFPSIAIHVIFPSIVIGSTLLVILVLSLVIYFQRFTVKVLLYIICGFRGFVDKPEKQHGLRYDCAIIYAKGDPNFDDNRIVTNLTDMGYRVADAYKHSVIGFTFFDGIHELIATSRRVIFFMTCNTIDNELMATLWNYTYSRAIKHDIASLILITDDEFKVKCSDENIKGYLKNGRYINVASKLLFKRIEYMMPARNIGETLDHWDTFVSHEYEMSCLRHKYIMKPKTTVSVSDKKPDIYIVFPDELGTN